MSETPAPYSVRPLSVPVMQCPVAGFQYHSGESCWALMRPGDSLTLRREPGNRHDPRAITVKWRDLMLGYIPREANYALSQMMDGGVRVEARVASLRPDGDSWQRVMMEVALPAPHTAPIHSPSAKPESPVFAAPELLVRSLVNRIFGASPPAGSEDWVRDRIGALAISGVEHHPMLPFLRMVAEDKSAASSADPVGALAELLRKAEIEPQAWKRLPRWGFNSFEALGTAWLKPLAVARFANLLLRLDVHDPPPRSFVRYALALAFRRVMLDACLDFERYPGWFMRALLKAVRDAVTPAQHRQLYAQAILCVEWLHDAVPKPDANQRHAGWSWVVAQAKAHREARALAISPSWEVPLGDMTFGAWRVVPLRSTAELAAEAAAMKNCLEDYEEACRMGEIVVFSIREALGGKRRACFSLCREWPNGPWELEQVAGKMNTEADEEMWRIAWLVTEKIRALD